MSHSVFRTQAHKLMIRALVCTFMLVSGAWQNALAEEPPQAVVPFYQNYALDLRATELLSFSFNSPSIAESSVVVVDTPEASLYADRIYVSISSVVQVRDDITEVQEAYLIPGAKARLKLDNGVFKEVQLFIYGREFENDEVEAMTGLTLHF